ncbi:MAG: UDP-4-amino-4,6-dideoxy-N-acetyl-beta-L-altrosamine transaminase [Alphaproteobacteria bacterium]|nr:UDP-4-amino-4,6-dideoxy-N-acetyl-beta-L-altrosamine transaminase [Alphaproteobacteria bacterium]
MTRSDFLPYGRQSIDDDDISAVVSALRADMLTTGPLVDAFEMALARATGAAHAVACNNGTSALYLAAKALDIGVGDVVIVPSMTFLATASAPHLAGAEIVFSDVDPDTGLMRPEDLETALKFAAKHRSERDVKAAFVVHLNGQTADMPALKAIADRSNVALVEDACHALGGLARTANDQGADGLDSVVGDCRWSSMAIFSFHPVKSVAMGEGGAVTTGDAAYAEKLRLLRNHGMSRLPADWENQGMAVSALGETNPWYYELVAAGFNFRVPDILCALGISQMRKLDRWSERRRLLHQEYCTLLDVAGLPDIAPARVSWGRPAWHLCAVRIPFAERGLDRASVMLRLRSEFGVGSQVHYIPVHRQTYWRHRYGVFGLPGADHYYSSALSLPLYPSLTDADVNRVVDALARTIS